MRKVLSNLMTVIVTGSQKKKGNCPCSFILECKKRKFAVLTFIQKRALHIEIKRPARFQNNSRACFVLQTRTKFLCLLSVEYVKVDKVKLTRNT